MDPPYLLTTSSYNDGKRGFKGWNDKTENELLKFTDKLNKNKIKFMISYLLKHKGKVNHKLSNWIKERNFKLINIKANTAVKREEVMILNYN
jgi:adenine-specific DNA-methyltransferase